MRKKLLKWVFIIVFLPLVVFAQTRKITGRVIDEKGLPVPRATVQVKGTTNGTTADENGNFTINVDGDRAVLVITSANFMGRELQVGNQSSLDVMLQGGENLSEIVVTAFGIKKEKRPWVIPHRKLRVKIL